MYFSLICEWIKWHYGTWSCWEYNTPLFPMNTSEMLYYNEPLTPSGNCITCGTCCLPPLHWVPQRSGPEASEPVRWNPVGEPAYRCPVSCFQPFFFIRPPVKSYQKASGGLVFSLHGLGCLGAVSEAASIFKNHRAARRFSCLTTAREATT